MSSICVNCRAREKVRDSIYCRICLDVLTPDPGVSFEEKFGGVERRACDGCGRFLPETLLQRAGPPLRHGRAGLSPGPPTGTPPDAEGGGYLYCRRCEGLFDDGRELLDGNICDKGAEAGETWREGMRLEAELRDRIEQTEALFAEARRPGFVPNGDNSEVDSAADGRFSAFQAKPSVPTGTNERG